MAECPMNFDNEDGAGVHSKIKELSNQSVGDNTINRGTRGAIIGILNQLCGGNMGRHHLLRIIFDKTSTNELTESEWYALWAWVKPYKDDSPTGDNKWHGAAYLYQQIQLLQDPVEV